MTKYRDEEEYEQHTPTEKSAADAPKRVKWDDEHTEESAWEKLTHSLLRRTKDKRQREFYERRLNSIAAQSGLSKTKDDD